MTACGAGVVDLVKAGSAYVADGGWVFAAGMHLPIWKERHEIERGTASEPCTTGQEAAPVLMPDDVEQVVLKPEDWILPPGSEILPQQGGKRGRVGRLQEQNDAIRGPGHFEKVMEFLANARSAGMETHVMLTLTRANAYQVIPLGNLLRGLTARFTFNRLTH